MKKTNKVFKLILISIIIISININIEKTLCTKISLNKNNNKINSFKTNLHSSNLLNKKTTENLNTNISTNNSYKNNSNNNIKKTNSVLNLYLLFEYTYTCGTWFNRGKEVCNQINTILEKNGLNIIPSIKPYHMGELPEGYNGDFNIYNNNNNNKILVATS